MSAFQACGVWWVAFTQGLRYAPRRWAITLQACGPQRTDSHIEQQLQHGCASRHRLRDIAHQPALLRTGQRPLGNALGRAGSMPIAYKTAEIGQMQTS